MLQKEPDHSYARDYLCKTHVGRAVTLNQLRRHTEAVHEYEKALALAEGTGGAPFRKFYASTLARAGDHAEAVAEAQALETKANAEDRFFLSCVYATAADVVRTDTRQRPGERTSLYERYAQLAIATLKQLNRSGYFHDNADAVEFLRKAPEFDPIRQRQDFQQLVHDVENKQGLQSK